MLVSLNKVISSMHDAPEQGPDENCKLKWGILRHERGTVGNVKYS